MPPKTARQGAPSHHVLRAPFVIIEVLRAVFAKLLQAGDQNWRLRRRPCNARNRKDACAKECPQSAWQQTGNTYAIRTCDCLVPSPGGRRRRRHRRAAGHQLGVGGPDQLRRGYGLHAGGPSGDQRGLARRFCSTPARAAGSWTGGLLGGLYIALSLFLLPRLGVALLLALIVVGQMVASLAFDQLGIFGVPPHPASLTRVAGANALVGGVLLIKIG